MKKIIFWMLLLNFAACNSSPNELIEENRKLKAELSSLRQQLAEASGSKQSEAPKSIAEDFISVDWKDLAAFENRYLGKRVKVPMQFEISHIGGDAPKGHFFMLILVPGDGGSRFTYWPESLYPKFKGKEGRTFKADIYGYADRVGNGILGLAVVKYENGKFF